MGTYASPVDQLLKRGRPEGANDAIDFTALGIGPQHIPDLLRMLGDEELSDEELACYGQINAWRALGQLRAPEAMRYSISSPSKKTARTGVIGLLKMCRLFSVNTGRA